MATSNSDYTSPRRAPSPPHHHQPQRPQIQTATTTTAMHRIASSTSSQSTTFSPSATIPPTSQSHSGSSLSLENAISPHAGLPNPAFSALESVLSERNSLSAQNAQLWKLIEKQRSAYGQMLKELERIRGERDLYKARLVQQGQVAAMDGGGGKRLKASSSTSHMHNASSPDKDRMIPEDVSPVSAQSSTSNPRLGMVRHKSDDPGASTSSSSITGARKKPVAGGPAPETEEYYEQSRTPTSSTIRTASSRSRDQSREVAAGGEKGRSQSHPHPTTATATHSNSNPNPSMSVNGVQDPTPVLPTTNGNSNGSGMGTGMGIGMSMLSSSPPPIEIEETTMTPRAASLPVPPQPPHSNSNSASSTPSTLLTTSDPIHPPSITLTTTRPLNVVHKTSSSSNSPASAGGSSSGSNGNGVSMSSHFDAVVLGEGVGVQGQGQMGASKSTPMVNIHQPHPLAHGQHPATHTHTTTPSIASLSSLATSSTHTSQGGGLNLPPISDTVRYKMSRESRISLPDEAKRYIANMDVSSPLGSPHLASSSSSSSSPETVPHGGVNGNGNGKERGLGLGVVSEEGSQTGYGATKKGHTAESPRPFLELEDDDESDIDPNPGRNTNTNSMVSSELLDDNDGDPGVESDEGDEEDEDEGIEVDDPDPDADDALAGEADLYATNPFDDAGSGLGGLQTAKVKSGSGKATAAQFPLPPASPGMGVGPSGGVGVGGSGHATGQGRVPPPGLTLNTSQVGVGSHTHTPSWPSASSTLAPHSLLASSGPPGLESNNSSNNASNSLAPTTAQTQTRQQRALRDSYLAPLEPPAATFRQMPLINTDLKSATVQVVGSHIRANDKGKEVLSFVVAVGVVGKEGWMIEKFYSDVLALDSRLRQRCSRSTAKKIAPLPDSKLFKDHAPAKVDQRKEILQTYLQSIINLPIKDKNEIIVFFSSDVMRERTPVTQNGYKEGYLTKRGKNFGGWKTRYFVLQGPVLEYYESRGGTHLGSITITGAQIGRQQKSGDKRDLDDENEYRHAFLIIEAKKGPAGTHPRHVLCAESDEERDAWVEVLVRYVMGSYNDDPTASILHPGPYQNGSGQPSSSSLTHSDSGSRRPVRGMSKDDIKVTTNAVPISKLSMDSSTAKFFQSAPLPDELSASSPAKSSLGPSPVERSSASTMAFSDLPTAKKLMENNRGQEPSPVSDEPLSSSLPTSSPIDAAGRPSVGQRSNSSLGHYPESLDVPSSGRASSDQQRKAPRERLRASYHPTLGTVKSSPTTERPSSPSDGSITAVASNRSEGNSKVKISGPLGGTPIPAGYKFGAKDPPSEATPTSNDRERKAKSRTFWGFGRQTNDKAGSSQHTHPLAPARAVFGVSIQDSLSVAQIANLPAVAFRCIQYLEAKKADQEEGIYRLSGASAVIKSLKDRFNAEGDVDLLASDEFWDPHAIAGLLKSFLRELPTSILTRDLHMRFLGVIDFVDSQERVKELSELISKLPLANYSLLRALTAHLILIVQNSNVNKMTVRNVGIVFSPTLGIPAGVFSLMLGEFNRVFNVDGDGFDSAAEEESDLPSPKRLSGLSRRNSRQYTDAAADQLLGLSGRTLPTTDEGQSDDGDDISVESGTENTDAETQTTRTVESSADSSRAISPTPPPPSGSYQEHLHPSNNETTPQKSRASHVAASRGLNIRVGADRRHSRMPIGLPSSPRPFNRSPLQTPTSGTNGAASPAHTPR